MEGVSNVSSEEELLQLRNEGKISEAEYQDLLAAIQKATKVDTEPAAPEADKARAKRKLGKIAFALMLTGIILPALFFVLAQIMAHGIDANSQLSIGSWVVIGAAFEIVAFVLGVISWPDVFGKAAVVTISILILLLILFTA